MKNFFNKVFPFVFIFILWFAFAYPYFLQGKIPYSSTYQVNSFAPWDAYPGFASPVKNGAMPDVTTQIIPWKHFTIQTYKMGQIPLWNPNSFSGTPHLANYQSAVLSPFNILFFAFPFVDAWSLLVLLQPLLSGIFMYLFMRSSKVSKIGSLLSSVSFMFCGFIVVWMDYATLAYAALFIPLAFFAIEKFYSQKKIRYLMLLSLTFPLSFFSGHFAISIYFAIAVFGYLIYKFFSTKNISMFLVSLLYCFIGMLFVLPQVLPTIELYSQSLRSQLFQKVEVIPWGYLPTFIAPDFFGNPVTRNDWFGHYAEWNGYFGAISFFLALYALKIKKNKVWFFAILMLFSLLCAFPTPLLDAIVFLKIPVFSTSAASRIIILFIFAGAVLCGMGLDALIEDIKERKYKTIFTFIAFSIFTIVLLWSIVIGKFFFPLDKLAIARQNLLLPSALFALLTIAVVAFSFFKPLQKKKIYLALPIIILLIASFDSLRFVRKWQAFDPKNLFFPDVPVVSAFKKISDHQKVIGNFGAEASVYYNLPSLEGYDALYSKRYGEFIASILDKKVSESPRSVVIFPKNSKLTPKAVDLVNVAYIIHKTSDDFTGWTFPYWQYPGSQFSLVYSDNSYRIYKNNNALPHAFLVNNYTVETDPQKIINTLFSEDFNISKNIILEKDPHIVTPSSNAGSITINQYSPNKIEIAVKANSSGLLFLSDSFFPGWKAFVDKKEVEIYRADFSFRAVKVNKGESTVTFIYDPKSFTLGIYGAILGALFMCMSIVIAKKLNFFPKS